MTESEWKLCSKLKPVALERYCERVLAELRYLADDPEKSQHERYLAIHKAIHERNEILAIIFDGHARSTAQLKLTYMYAHKLVTPEELSQFSEQTRSAVMIH